MALSRIIEKALPDCHCKAVTSEEWAALVHGDPAIAECVCEVLDAYVDFATEEKRSEEDVDLLFDKVRRLLPSAIACQAQRIEKLAKYAVEKPNTGARVRSLADWVHHIENPDMKNMRSLLNMAQSEVFYQREGLPQAPRLDKVLFIEKFIDLAHGSGRLLDCACDYEVTREAHLGPGITSHLTRHILDCLADIPANPDQVMNRIRDKGLE